MCLIIRERHERSRSLVSAELCVVRFSHADLELPLVLLPVGIHPSLEDDSTRVVNFSDQIHRWPPCLDSSVLHTKLASKERNAQDSDVDVFM